MNDISIIELSEAVNLRPIPLASEVPKTNERCKVLGWGITVPSVGGNIPQVSPSDVLQIGELEIQNPKNCSAWYKIHQIPIDKERHLCAGQLDGSTDACQGDSGSPLVCLRHSGYELVGIVSWGIGCGEALIPGVYTNIWKFKTWVENRITATPSISAATGQVLPLNSKCSCGLSPQMRITNAGVASSGSWPWFVLVSRLNQDGQWRQMCGATLIDDRHALSAAHCFITEDFISGIGYVEPERFRFHLNFYQNGAGESSLLRHARWIRCHEKYIQRRYYLLNLI